jgi:hypothetical protein
MLINIIIDSHCQVFVDGCFIKRPQVDLLLHESRILSRHFARRSTQASASVLHPGPPLELPVLEEDPRWHQPAVLCDGSA